jgi:hypothetical protein
MITGAAYRAEAVAQYGRRGPAVARELVGSRGAWQVPVPAHHDLHAARESADVERLTLPRVFENNTALRTAAALSASPDSRRRDAP